MFKPVVRPMHDLIDRKWCRWGFGMGRIMRGKFLLDPRQPLIEQIGRPRVQCRK